MVKSAAAESGGIKALWSIVAVGVTAFFFILGVSVFALPKYATKAELEYLQVEVDSVRKEQTGLDREIADRLARIETKLENVCAKIDKQKE